MANSFAFARSGMTTGPLPLDIPVYRGFVLVMGSYVSYCVAVVSLFAHIWDLKGMSVASL